MIVVYWSKLLLLCLLAIVGRIDANMQSSRCAVTQVTTADVLNIRSQPHHRSKKVGAIPHNATSVLKLGPTQTVGQTPWFNIRYRNKTGWVNSKFLHCQLSSEEAQAALADRARHAVLTLRAQDMTQFATYIHPLKGVRFSPYAYVNIKQDLIHRADQIPTLFSDETLKRWGDYDGSGKPILLTFATYFHKFIYDRDFATASEVGYNRTIRTGNTIDNSRMVYPHGVIVDFHAPASSPSGMDWASLRLIFEEFKEEWYIVGIIHDHWTT